jgi:hypothetical protein
MTLKGRLYRASHAGSIIVHEAYTPMKATIDALRQSGRRSVRVEFYEPGRQTPNIVCHIG